MQAITVKNVSKSFKEKGKVFQALKTIDLDIENGEIFSLLGPNGAGKTTLLNIITGLLYPDTGYVRILGKDIRKDRDVLERINFVSGISRYHYVETVSNVLRFYSRVYGLKKQVADKRIKEVINLFKIRDIRNRRFSDLSIGEGARLNMAKALLNRPVVLLLDEPTLGLDPNIAIKVRKIIKRINKEFRTTILLTTHYMHEAEQLSDRVGFISKGEIIDMGSVSKVKLRRFTTYEAIMDLENILDKEFLLSNGFKVAGRKVKRMLNYEENISDILSLLTKRGFVIKDIEIKKPTLEDYFIEILKEKKR